jgi:hypothetical protein
MTAWQFTRFASLLFAALALAPATAHLAELPNKVALPAAAYLAVQQIYRGWALFGFVVAGALASTLAFTILAWRRGLPIALPLFAFLCIVGTQIVFWTHTAPANSATEQWTMLPQNWQTLRTQWEYSHALSAVLNLAALLALIGAVVSPRSSP